MAEGLQLHPGGLRELFASKYHMEGGRRGDLRKIWDALSEGWLVENDDEDNDEDGPSEYIEKRDGEAGWTRLEQIVAMSKEDWLALRLVDDEDQENDEGEESEEEDEEEEVEQIGQEGDDEDS